MNATHRPRHAPIRSLRSGGEPGPSTRRVAPVALSLALACTCAAALGDDGESGTDDDAEASPDRASAPPGTVVVDEDAALRALESALLRADALLLQPGSVMLTVGVSASSDTDTSTFLATGVDENGESGSVLAYRDSTVRRFSSVLAVDVGMPLGFQVGLAFPLAQSSERADIFLDDFVIEEDRTSDVAGGDLEISLQKSLMAQRGRRPDLIAAVFVDSATGSSEGLEAGSSSGAIEYGLSLTATARQDPLVFSGTLGYVVTDPRDDDVDDSGSTDIRFGAFLAASPYTSLQFQFAHTSFPVPDEAGRARANRGNVGTLTLGGSSTVGRRTSLAYGVGAGLSEAATDYTVSLTLSRTFR